MIPGGMLPAGDPETIHGMSREDYIAYRVARPLTASGKKVAEQAKEMWRHMPGADIGDFSVYEVDELMSRVAVTRACDCGSGTVHDRPLTLEEFGAAVTALVAEIRSRRRT